MKKALSFMTLTFMALVFMNAEEIITVPKIDAPANVTIVYSDSTVTIDWDAVPNTSKYYIYNQNDPYSVFVLVDSTVTTAWEGNYIENKKFFQISAKETPPPAGFIFVQGGTFQMGDSFIEGQSNERPVHSVTLSSFYMGKYEVTQAEWTQYMPADLWSSYGTGATYPAYYLSWYKIIKYCNLRSMSESLTPVYTINSSTNPADWGAVPTSSNSTWNAAICNWSANGYRLPSEAEWEYAARGGLSGQRFPNGATISHSTNGDTQANYYAKPSSYSYDVSPTTGWHPSYYKKSSPVGSFPPNGYGLYDMSGNLYEWCWDWIGSYTSDAQTDPTGPATGSNRVLRGDDWYITDGAPKCRVAYRSSREPFYLYYGYGFRLARKP